MKSKHFTDRELAISFIRELTAGNKHTVDITEGDDGTINVSYIANKTYVSHTGDTHTDEVWSTADGSMLNIQDLSEDHAKNIVRMIIRNRRGDLIDQSMHNIDFAQYPGYVGYVPPADDEGPTIH